MKVIKQRDTPASFAYVSSAPESYGYWSPTSNYTAGTQVLYATPATPYVVNIYSAIATTTGDTPNSSPLKWALVGPSNQWAMFDSQVSTRTTANDSLVVSVVTGAIDSVAFSGLLGSSISITVTDGVGGPTTYTATSSLDDSVVIDAYTYCFEPIVQKSEVYFTNIPQYSGSIVYITVTGGTSGIGNMVYGNIYDLGLLRYGATVSILDYSRKETDDFGTTTFVKRAFSRRITGSMEVPKSSITKLFSILSGMRATPAMWIGVDDSELGALSVYGYYKDFTVSVDYPYHSLCSLELEGLT
jgi:hypothetical protein